MPKILIIEDDASFCLMLQKYLIKKGFEVVICHTIEIAKTKFATTVFDLVLTDLRFSNSNGIDLLSFIKKRDVSIPVLVMTSYAQVETAVLAMKKGAFDYISKPFRPEEILMKLNDALTTIDKEEVLAKIKSDTVIIGTSEATLQLKEHIVLVAPTAMSVLIHGDSGTGKEVTARAIHNTSKRKKYDFVAVDCGAIPKELATSAFFGHIKGSFTGAIEDKKGYFETAHKGTLFLDEIGNLSYENQVQLLRVLQERNIKRIGGTKEIKIDVRIVTATNENLKQAVKDGRFREDLFHRINEFCIEVPSLKRRGDDLLLFMEYFLNKANDALEKEVLSFSKEVLNAFQTYHWPGNIRELQNVIKRAVLLTTESQVELEVLPKEITQVQLKKYESQDFSKTVYEKEQILKALKKTNFNKSEAAKLLQITRKTLYNRINYYKMNL